MYCANRYCKQAISTNYSQTGRSGRSGQSSWCNGDFADSWAVNWGAYRIAHLRPPFLISAVPGASKVPTHIRSALTVLVAVFTSLIALGQVAEVGI